MPRTQVILAVDLVPRPGAGHRLNTVVDHRDIQNHIRTVHTYIYTYRESSSQRASVRLTHTHPNYDKVTAPQDAHRKLVYFDSNTLHTFISML